MKTAIATGVTTGLAERIIDGPHVLFFQATFIHFFFLSFIAIKRGLSPKNWAEIKFPHIFSMAVFAKKKGSKPNIEATRFYRVTRTNIWCIGTKIEGNTFFLHGDLKNYEHLMNRYENRELYVFTGWLAKLRIFDTLLLK